VTIQIAPFRAGANAAVGRLNVLRFAERDLPGVVYLEQLTKPLYLDKRETVDHYLAVMDRLCLEAAPAASTAKAINAILRDRCHGDRPGDDILTIPTSGLPRTQVRLSSTLRRLRRVRLDLNMRPNGRKRRSRSRRSRKRNLPATRRCPTLLSEVP
jgi:hypothetical protein